MNEAVFSCYASYYLNIYSSAQMPPITTINKAINGTIQRVLAKNYQLEKTSKEYQLVKKQFISFKAADGSTLNGYMLSPDIQKENVKHPCLMYVYGGPGDQEVLNEWMNVNDLWHQILVAHGYVVVCVDNRGTGGKGDMFKKQTYLQLGKLESEDQIAVAPVTNWRYYDNVYTERFMRTPQENGLSYDDNSPISHVEKLKGNYLLIHGTADDNVHFQNSVMLTEALLHASKDFDMFI